MSSECSPLAAAVQRSRSGRLGVVNMKTLSREEIDEIVQHALLPADPPWDPLGGRGVLLVLPADARPSGYAGPSEHPSSALNMGVRVLRRQGPRGRCHYMAEYPMTMGSGARAPKSPLMPPMISLQGRARFMLAIDPGTRCLGWALLDTGRWYPRDDHYYPRIVDVGTLDLLGKDRSTLARDCGARVMGWLDELERRHGRVGWAAIEQQINPSIVSGGTYVGRGNDSSPNQIVANAVQLYFTGRNDIYLTRLRSQKASPDDDDDDVEMPDARRAAPTATFVTIVPPSARALLLPRHDHIDVKGRRAHRKKLCMAGTEWLLGSEQYNHFMCRTRERRRSKADMCDALYIGFAALGVRFPRAAYPDSLRDRYDGEIELI